MRKLCVDRKKDREERQGARQTKSDIGEYKRTQAMVSFISSVQLSELGGVYSEVEQRAQQQTLSGEAVQRMLTRVDGVHSRLRWQQEGCPVGCECGGCRERGYTSNTRLRGGEVVLWRGTAIINPNTPFYCVRQVKLTYTHFASYPIYEQLTKIKYLVDGKLDIPVIRLTNEGETLSSTVVMTNRSEIQGLFIAMLGAALTVNYKYYVPRVESVPAIMEGKLWRRLAIKGEWSQRAVKIEKGRLSLDGGSARDVMSTCLWTKFDFMREESPYLIVKIWQGMFKVQYGIPLPSLYLWISSFLSLIGSNP